MTEEALKEWGRDPCRYAHGSLNYNKCVYRTLRHGRRFFIWKGHREYLIWNTVERAMWDMISDVDEGRYTVVSESWVGEEAPHSFKRKVSLVRARIRIERAMHEGRWVLVDAISTFLAWLGSYHDNKEE